MATSTTRLALSKPAGTDIVDIEVLNANADKLDTAAGAQVVTSTTRPSAPYNGQIIYETDTNTTLVWKSTSSEWVPVGGSTVSTSAPAGAASGDFWWDSDTGRLYVYYTDANSSQWVAASNSSTNTVGLVPIVAPTVAVSGGTATANTLGVVSFSGATSVRLDGVFTSAYANYLVKFTGEPASGAASFSLRFSTSGTENSTTNYSYTGWEANSTALNRIYDLSINRFPFTNSYSTIKSSADINVYNPNLAVKTTYNFGSNGHTGAGIYARWNAGDFGLTTVFDGISITTSASTMTGTVTVYGYNS